MNERFITHHLFLNPHFNGELRYLRAKGRLFPEKTRLTKSVDVIDIDSTMGIANEELLLKEKKKNMEVFIVD